MRLSFVEPMKALPVEKLPEGDWLYEIKFDVYHALCLQRSRTRESRLAQSKDVRVTATTRCAEEGASLKLHPGWRNCRARQERSLAVPTPPVIQKVRRCPAGLFRLRPAVPRRERSVSTTAKRQTQTPRSGA